MDVKSLEQNINELIDIAFACCADVPRPYAAAMLIKDDKVVQTAIKKQQNGAKLPPEYQLIKGGLETQGAVMVSLIEPSAQFFIDGGTINLYQEIKDAGIKKFIYVVKSPFYYRRNGTNNLLAPLGVEVDHFDNLALVKRITPLIWPRLTPREASENIKYMEQAIILARQTPQNLPHPYVGVLIVKDSRIISRGVKMIEHIGKNKHSIFHAERIAVEHSEESVEGATMYSTLEPCVHLGNPNEIIGDCATLILESGIERVVFGMQDTGNSGVFGRGIERLMEWGVVVHNHSTKETYNDLQNLMGKYRSTYHESDNRRPLKSRL